MKEENIDRTKDNCLMDWSVLYIDRRKRDREGKRASTKRERERKRREKGIAEDYHPHHHHVSSFAPLGNV